VREHRGTDQQKVFILFITQVSNTKTDALQSKDDNRSWIVLASHLILNTHVANNTLNGWMYLRTCYIDWNWSRLAWQNDNGDGHINKVKLVKPI